MGGSNIKVSKQHIYICMPQKKQPVKNKKNETPVKYQQLRRIITERSQRERKGKARTNRQNYSLQIIQGTLFSSNSPSLASPSALSESESKPLSNRSSTESSNSCLHFPVKLGGDKLREPEIFS